MIDVKKLLNGEKIIINIQYRGGGCGSNKTSGANTGCNKLVETI